MWLDHPKNVIGDRWGVTEAEVTSLYLCDDWYRPRCCRRGGGSLFEPNPRTCAAVLLRLDRQPWAPIAAAPVPLPEPAPGE